MRRSVESDLLRLTLTMSFVASCSAEPLETPTATIQPTVLPLPTATITPSLAPSPTNTWTPSPSITPSLTPTVRNTLLPLHTPDFRLPSKCLLKPKVSQETIDYLYKTEIYSGNRNRKVVLLTYDDVGSEDQLETILGGLRKYGAKASFFINGPMFSMSPNAVKKIVAEGHVLAIHSFGHAIFTELTAEQIDDDFCRFIAESEKVIPGYKYRYFRFPYGARDQLSRWWVASWEVMNVVWDLESGGKSAASSYDNVVNNIGNGKIVLLHMGNGADVAATEPIVRKLTENGFSLESLETGLR